MLGWSWLVPPHRWHVRRPRRRATSAVVFDGACLRAKCDAGPAARLRAHCSAWPRCMHARLQAARVRLLDLYGAPDASSADLGARSAAARTTRCCRAVASSRERGRTPSTRRRSCSSRSTARPSPSRPVSSRCSAGSASARYRSRSAATRPPRCCVHTIRDVGGVTHAAACRRQVGDVLEVRGPVRHRLGGRGRPGRRRRRRRGRHRAGAAAPGGAGRCSPTATATATSRCSTAPGAPPTSSTPTSSTHGADQGIDVRDHRRPRHDRLARPGRPGHRRCCPRADVDPAQTLALVCGPEVMMRFVTGRAASTSASPPDRIRLSHGAQHEVRRRPVRPLPAARAVRLRRRPGARLPDRSPPCSPSGRCDDDRRPPRPSPSGSSRRATAAS